MTVTGATGSYACQGFLTVPTSRRWHTTSNSKLKSASTTKLKIFLSRSIATIIVDGSQVSPPVWCSLIRLIVNEIYPKATSSLTKRELGAPSVPSLSEVHFKSIGATQKARSSSAGPADSGALPKLFRAPDPVSSLLYCSGRTESASGSTIRITMTSFLNIAVTTVERPGSQVQNLPSELYCGNLVVVRHR